MVRNRVMELLAAGQKVWRFEGGEPWMDTPETVKAAMGRRSRATRPGTRPPRGSPSCAGHPREGPDSQRHSRPTTRAPIVVNGGMQGLFAAFATLLDPGDEVLMFSPYWTPIVDLVGYHQATAVLVPTAAARREGSADALARQDDAADEAHLLELAEQSHRRRLLAGRDRGGRGVRARTRARRRLRRGLRRPRLRGRAARRDRVAARGCSSARSPASRSRRATR